MAELIEAVELLIFVAFVCRHQPYQKRVNQPFEFQPPSRARWVGPALLLGFLRNMESEVRVSEDAPPSAGEKKVSAREKTENDEKFPSSPGKCNGVVSEAKSESGGKSEEPVEPSANGSPHPQETNGELTGKHELIDKIDRRNDSEGKQEVEDVVKTEVEDGVRVAEKEEKAEAVKKENEDASKDGAKDVVVAGTAGEDGKNDLLHDFQSYLWSMTN